MTKQQRSSQVEQVLDMLKIEIAQELGMQLPQDGYYGHMITRDIGTLGGQMTKKLVRIAEEIVSWQR